MMLSVAAATVAMAVVSLGDDDYGQLIKGGLERLGERLTSV